jgi:hypothetical protein
MSMSSSKTKMCFTGLIAPNSVAIACRASTGARWRNATRSVLAPPDSMHKCTATGSRLVAFRMCIASASVRNARIGGLSIPFWVSWLGVLVAGALACFGFTQQSSPAGRRPVAMNRSTMPLPLGGEFENTTRTFSLPPWEVSDVLPLSDDEKWAAIKACKACKI